MTKNIKELEWDNGIYTLNNVPYSGCATQYYPDGKMAAESNFMNGYFEGIQRVWYLNGQLKTEYRMKDNIYHGFATSWFENGVLRFEVEYNMGEEVWSKMYNEQGELVKQYP